MCAQLITNRRNLSQGFFSSPRSSCSPASDSQGFGSGTSERLSSFSWTWKGRSSVGRPLAAGALLAAGLHRCAIRHKLLVLIRNFISVDAGQKKVPPAASSFFGVKAAQEPRRA